MAAYARCVACHCTLAPGEIVAVLGANGAGKSSLLRALLGIDAAAGGTRSFSTATTSALVHERAGTRRAGAGAGRPADRQQPDRAREPADGRRATAAMAPPCDARSSKSTSAFPIWRRAGTTLASVLSGGEQQMLAIGRALLAAPKLMMLDEPSLGLSPRLANEVFAHIRDLNRTHGLTILLVEQNTQRALEIAHRAYLLELGRVLREGPPRESRPIDSLLDAYLGRGQARKRAAPVNGDHLILTRRAES